MPLRVSEFFRFMFISAIYGRVNMYRKHLVLHINKMNILFLTKDLEPGGIQTVTVFLANVFSKMGHQVDIAIFTMPQNEMLKQRIDKDVPLHILDGYSCSTSNERKLRLILTERKIDVVINQYGLPYLPVRLIRKACKGLVCKVISVYHSDPIANARILAIEQKLCISNNLILRHCLKGKKCLFSLITRMSMRYVYNKSDHYVLLSNSFIKNFSQFTHLNDTSKISIISNPVTIDSKDYQYQNSNKEKRILYVGRIETIVKRVDRVIDVWSLLEKDFKDWQLVIVGEGDALLMLKEKVERLCLKNVQFEGFQEPSPYYEKASILMLTSDFEGFGLTLVEGMKFGVVPVAYGSYAAVDDIIDDKINGYIIRPENGQFNPQEMALKLKQLMTDAELRDNMARHALHINDKFCTANIVAKWNQLFKNL